MISHDISLLSLKRVFLKMDLLSGAERISSQGNIKLITFLKEQLPFTSTFYNMKKELFQTLSRLKTYL